MSVKMLLHRYMGPAAVGGYAKFWAPGTSTLKTTYTSNYTTAATLNAAFGVPINSNGFLKTYLLGDYDMTVFDSTGTELTGLAASGLNPQESDVTNSVNLISNGSFETDANGDSVPDNWTLTSYSGATNAMDSTDKAQGVYSMKFTSTGNGGGFIISDDFMECSPERAVEISFLLKSTADVRNLVEVIWYTAAEVEISDTDIYDENAANPTSWATRGAVVVPPATAYYMKIRIYGCHSSDATAGTARFDGVTVKLLDTEIVSIASATTVDLTKVTGTKRASITGTTTITALTLSEGQTVVAAFTGILTLTHGASLILPSSVNITTAAGDVAVFGGEASGVVRCIGYLPKAAVTNYVSAMRSYQNVNGANATAFNIVSNVTESTFESVGPTGSGATNIWTALDDLPAGATKIQVSVMGSLQPDGADRVSSLAVYARQTGSAQAVGEPTFLHFHQLLVDDYTAGVPNNFGMAEIPLDTSRRFDITWAATADTQRSAEIKLRGFAI
jgi:hypothetical protein